MYMYSHVSLVYNVAIATDSNYTSEEVHCRTFNQRLAVSQTRSVFAGSLKSLLVELKILKAWSCMYVYIHDALSSASTCTCTVHCTCN